MKNILILLFLLSFTISYSQSKNVKAKELMSLMGQQNLSSNLSTLFIDQFRQKYPKVDEVFWKKMETEIDVNSLIDSSTNIYEKYFTDKEIDELLEFYKSPLGKKMVQNVPLIIKESQSIGANWVMEVEKKIKNDLIKEGYLSPSTSNSNYLPPPPPANKNNPR